MIRDCGFVFTDRDWDPYFMDRFDTREAAVRAALSEGLKEFEVGILRETRHTPYCRSYWVSSVTHHHAITTTA